MSEKCVCERHTVASHSEDSRCSAAKLFASGEKFHTHTHTHTQHLPGVRALSSSSSSCIFFYVACVRLFSSAFENIDSRGRSAREKCDRAEKCARSIVVLLSLCEETNRVVPAVLSVDN